MKLFRRTEKPHQEETDPHFAVPDIVQGELFPVGEELSRLEESARVSSQAQFEQGKYWRGCNLVLGIPAGVLGVVAGGAGVSDALPIEWVGLAALIAAMLSGAMTVLTAERRAQQAQTCGNAFLDIQEDARRMLLVDLRSMDLATAREELRALTARYSEIRHTAAAPALRFYRKARRNIRSGGQSYAIDRARDIDASEEN